MSTRLFYVDESHDERKYCLSAISIRHSEWRGCQDRLRDHRATLKQEHGLYLRKEIHATEFLGGRGRVSDRIIGKHQRSRIFAGLLSSLSSLPSIYLINICLDVRGRKDPQMDAWDRLINRIERTMRAAEEGEFAIRRGLLSKLPETMTREDRQAIERRLLAFSPRAIIVADQGREAEITKALRRMAVFNPVPSQFGGWDNGDRAQNIAVQRIIEDPMFKLSHQSYLVQMADCVAYALLKREVEPTPNVKKYALNKMFDQYLSGICFTRASPRDPLGIVRK